MALSQASAWLHQAHSDYVAAARVFDKTEASTYCHAIAKHQQTVEKATKAVTAALEQAGSINIQIKFSHGITYLVNALERLTSKATLQKEAAHFAVYDVGAQGAVLMGLAPKRPPNSATGLARNTEYPYNEAPNSWRSPAEEGSFSQEEVAQFANVANRTLQGAKRILDAVRRIPGMAGRI